MTSRDFAEHDQCPRLRTWTAKYELPRISLAEALNEGLRAGLLSGDYLKAGERFMALAANPGLDIEGRVYDAAFHHARLLEVLASYLVTDGPWKPADPVAFGSGTFEPLSYQMPDGRLRRVVLCSAWHSLREQEERTSWWTVADTAITGRPMLVNVLVIGSAKAGFRQSPWTCGYVHPENGTLRIRRKEGQFTERWKRVYREQTDRRALDWLTKMQQDEAFEGVVESFTADVPPNREEVLQDMGRMAREIDEQGTAMRRSACFRLAPCRLSSLCHHDPPLTPQQAGYREKSLVLALSQ